MKLTQNSTIWKQITTFLCSGQKSLILSSTFCIDFYSELTLLNAPRYSLEHIEITLLSLNPFLSLTLLTKKSSRATGVNATKWIIQTMYIFLADSIQTRRIICNSKLTSHIFTTQSRKWVKKKYSQRSW